MTSLTFPPSRHGSGCEATITGYRGQHEPDGWFAADYGDLRGIAIEPDRDRLSTGTGTPATLAQQVLGWARGTRRVRERGGTCMGRHGSPRSAHLRNAASSAATRMPSTALLSSSISLTAWMNRSMPAFISGMSVSSRQAVNMRW